MNLLTELYKISAKSGCEGEIKEFVRSCLKGLSLQIVEDEIGNLFITKGVADTYPCITAHLDEVHLPCERNIVVAGDKVYAVNENKNQVGCGADDKNGIWIAINLLHTRPVLKVALFVEEEKVGEIAGCRGSRACNLSFFDNAQYVLACDRKASTEVVYIGKNNTQLCGKDFIPEELLSEFNYQMVEGGKTDVVELKMRGLKIPVCNISCGYYNAHTSEEYTIFSELQHSLRFVKAIIERKSN